MVNFDCYPEDIWKRICSESRNNPPDRINMFMVGALFKLNYWYGILLNSRSGNNKLFIGKHEGIISIILFTDLMIAQNFSKKNFEGIHHEGAPIIPQIIRIKIPDGLEDLHNYSNIGVGSIVFNVNIENCAFRVNNKQILQMYGWHLENDPRFIDH